MSPPLLDSLNLNVSVGVGKVTESSNTGIDLMAKDFNRWVVHILPLGRMAVPVSVSVS